MYDRKRLKNVKFFQFKYFILQSSNASSSALITRGINLKIILISIKLHLQLFFI